MVSMLAAAEGNTVLPEAVVNAIQEGVGKVSTGAQEGLVAILPAGLGVFALFFGVKIAINFFRSLAHA